MPDILTQSYLERNLSCLGPANRDLAEALRQVEPAPLVWETTEDGALTAALDGRRLASRHQPREEARRLAEGVDIINHAVVIALGFGVGWHVAALAKRLDRAGVIIVFEPDLALLRAVFERIDCADWLRESIVVWMFSADDRAALASKLSGAESIVAQGVAFLEHPAHRARLAESTKTFTTLFSEFVQASKTTLITTLVRSQNTIENLLGNLDHYVLAPGIADLKDAARNRLGVVVSAGPSLRRNLHLLARPGMRERCVIIAVQTTLKPLLEAGIRPHFVTALDYHEISSRFYEGITAADVEGVTLIAEAKAHPVILDAFPGTIRCVGNGFLDKILGPLQRDMGTLPAGATVAHLAFYLARHLGCDPIALIGQDLGFTDGLYYARGTAIHDIWATELNPFNTIEMMEWQRIARHRLHLHKTVDHEGKSIYTDAQMQTYLQQFERDFAEATEAGATIIDASEGGVRKQHAIVRPLAEVLAEHAVETMPPLAALAPAPVEPHRLESTCRRLETVRRNIASLQATSRRTTSLLRDMLRDQQDAAKMNRHFAKMEAHRETVDRLFEEFELLNYLNQLGVFRRHRSDRKLHLAKELDPLEKQRAQLERDLDNVTWIADAADEMIAMLARAERRLSGDSNTSDATPSDAAPISTIPDASTHRFAALIAIDPERGGLFAGHDVAALFGDRTLLQATLERLGTSRRLERIILLVPATFDVEALMDRSRVPLPIEIERCGESPFGREHEAVRIARRVAPHCWRGGIAGIAGVDEALCPAAMYIVMERHALDAAVIVGPDWPFVEVTGAAGVDALIDRYLEQPEQHGLVFSQTPPGLGGVLLSRSLMKEFSARNRLATVGGILVYQPHAPQHDPIAREANVQVDHRVRRSLIRAVAETPFQRARLERVLRSASDPTSLTSLEIVQALEAEREEHPLPSHVILELTSERIDTGAFAASRGSTGIRPPLEMNRAERLLAEIGPPGEIMLTLGGFGDPLLHPDCATIVRRAKQAGVAVVHVRTALLAERSTLDELLDAGVDVISVDLHADCGTTYTAMMGCDRFKEALLNIEYVLDHRRRLTPHAGNEAFALPWVVPRLQRCRLTYEDIDSFYDRWMTILGTAVIEGAPMFEDSDTSLASALAPERVMEHELAQRLLVLSDGSIPLSEMFSRESTLVGRVGEAPLAALWRTLRDERSALCAREGETSWKLRTMWP